MTKSEHDTKFDNFLNTRNNTFIKVLPNKNSPQCFDLAVCWTDILGVPHYGGNPSPFPYVNAYEIYKRPNEISSKYFEFIPNTPDYVPQKGDILVWDGKLNGDIGHVAVATGQGDTNTFQSFSQNYPLNSNAHLIRTNYDHVLGALRYKVTNSGSTEPKPTMTDLERKNNVQMARATIELKKAGLIPTDGTEYWHDNPQDEDKFANFVKRLIRDSKGSQVDVEAIKKAAKEEARQKLQANIDTAIKNSTL